MRVARRDDPAAKAPPAAGDNLRRPRRRPPDLEPARAAAIVAVIGRMAGRVDWARVVDAVAEEMGTTYTRQTLSGHVSIHAAYKERKRGTKPKPGVRSRSSGMQAALDRAAKLEAERDAARLQVRQLLEMNERYVVNAQNYGMPMAVLVAPVTRIERA